MVTGYPRRLSVSGLAPRPRWDLPTLPVESGRTDSACADRQPPGFLQLKRHSLPPMVAFRRHNVESDQAFRKETGRGLPLGKLLKSKVWSLLPDLADFYGNTGYLWRLCLDRDSTLGSAEARRGTLLLPIGPRFARPGPLSWEATEGLNYRVEQS